MSKKTVKIASLIQQFEGSELDAHYLGYFDCFNRQLFYEAHDVLEELWLAHRALPDGLFYKGLIQFAGAFVHLQRNRLRPAVALFKLAQAQLRKYLPMHLRLDVGEVLTKADWWIERLERTDYACNPLTDQTTPELRLLNEEAG